MKAALMVLNSHLFTRTYLVGERITLADIVVASNLLNPYKYVLDPDYRRPFTNVNRWFMTLISQPEFKAILGEVQLCSQVAQTVAVNQEGKVDLLVLFEIVNGDCQLTVIIIIFVCTLILKN